MTCECGKVTDDDECVSDCKATAICHNCKASIVPGRYWYIAASIGTRPLCSDCWHELMETRGG